MALVGTLVSISGSLLLTPFLLFLLVILFLASIGKSIGVRRLYVKTLLKLFEYGRQHIEIANKQKNEEDSGFSSEDEGDSSRAERQNQPTTDNTHSRSNGHTRSASFGSAGDTKNSVIKNGLCASSSLISRESLVLAPDPNHNRSHRRTSSIGSSEKLPDKSEYPPPLQPLQNNEKDNGDDGSPLISDENQDQQEAENSPLNKDHRRLSFETLKREFELAECLTYVRAGVEAIIEDEVTQCFQAEELKSWNLLTRTNRHYEFISWRLTVIWMLGFLVRYFLLLPLRVLICFIGVYWLTFCTAVVGYVPAGPFKRWLNNKVSIMCFGLLSSALSAVITYHNPENKPQRGICVANHTSPIDVLVLACDNCYALIGQRHGGFLGLLQRALARASSHIWFERSEVKDREFVTRRLKEHVSDPNNPPILIFPEGTCINNTSVMQFKKGSFEVGGVIYPVAIKYDPKFGDAFWNSSEYSMMQYLYMMMTSWAIVCDVWYLPAMEQEEGESAIDFANRVKSVIATQGGLVDLMWDGQLKRVKVKKEWKERQQEEFSKRLKVE